MSLSVRSWSWCPFVFFRYYGVFLMRQNQCEGRHWLEDKYTCILTSLLQVMSHHSPNHSLPSLRVSQMIFSAWLIVIFNLSHLKIYRVVLVLRRSGQVLRRPAWCWRRPGAASSWCCVVPVLRRPGAASPSLWCCVVLVLRRRRPGPASPSFWCCVVLEKGPGSWSPSMSTWGKASPTVQ